MYVSYEHFFHHIRFKLCKPPSICQSIFEYIFVAAILLLNIIQYYPIVLSKLFLTLVRDYRNVSQNIYKFNQYLLIATTEVDWSLF